MALQDVQLALSYPLHVHPVDGDAFEKEDFGLYREVREYGIRL